MLKNLFKNKSLDTLPLDFRVENHPLDREQRKAIYDPARFNLTVAGAGSGKTTTCLLYTSPSPRDRQTSRMPSSA